ncbi:hypothetical protein BH10ACI2_BH10ACI2_24380 [soil metagenome]
MSTFLNKDYFALLGIRLDAGLSDQEVANTEDKYGFRFPPDLRELLQFGLPSGRGFVDWRNGRVEDIKYILDGPFDGICFDIEQNNFWLDEWGEKPEILVNAFAVAKTFIDKVPKLIPVYGHRYIPDSPSEAKNPIFSVVQTDIIIYGNDLESYLKIEFAKSNGLVPDVPTMGDKFIEFWTKLVELNNDRAAAIFEAESSI